MFNKIIRYYNQNRKTIWKLVIIILAIIVTIKVANLIAKNINEGGNISKSYSKKKLQSVAIIDGESLSIEEATKNKETLNKFVSSCNEGNVTEAYDMLTDECKNQIFSTEDKFSEIYYNSIFKAKKEYDIFNWFSSSEFTTYMINYSNNALLDGGYKGEEKYTDYVTVVNQNEERKISLLGLIKEDILEKTYSDENIDLLIKKVDIYMDYEIFDISIINKTGNDIEINPDDQDWYITDKDNNKYYIDVTTIKTKEKILKQNTISSITLKFGKTYNPMREDNEFILNNFIIDNSKRININVKL